MAKGIYDPEKDSVDEIRKKYDAQYKNQYKGAYNIGTYEYPEGLRVKPDLQHYVAFYINVREKSQITQSRRNLNKDYLVDDERKFWKRLNRESKTVRSHSRKPRRLSRAWASCRNRLSLSTPRITLGIRSAI